MMLRTAIFLLECAFSGVFLWLGLYLLTRDRRGADRRWWGWWGRPAPVTGLALLFGACYLLGAAMQAITDDPAALGRWLRLTWWAIPLPAVTVFRAVLLLTTPADRPSGARRLGDLVSALLVLVGVGLGVANVATDRFFDFGRAQRLVAPPHYLEITTRAPFDREAAFIVGVQLAVAALALRQYVALRDEARRHSRWVVVAMALQLVGTALDVAWVVLDVGIPREVGNAILFAGIALLGYGVARHGALFRHEILARDFYRSLAGAALTGAAFVLAFAGVHALVGATPTPESIPLLLWLAILTITLTPWVAARLDEIFLPRGGGRARRALTRAGDELAVAGDQQGTLRQIEREVPAVLAATRQDLALRELQERIAADVNQLFRGTNYTRDGSDRYIALNTGLLSLAVVEDAATALMMGEGVDPQLDRDHYRLKAFQQAIAGLVAAMAAEADAAATAAGEPDSERHRRQRARATILQQQFLQDVPRAAVQQLLERRYYVGGGGGYGRLLLAAKQDLAQRLYLAERRARERRAAARDD